MTAAITTVAAAHANFPPSAAYRGMYVRVSDLFGYIDGVMRCGMDANSGLYFWQPTTPEYGRSIAAATMTLNPLTSPTSVSLIGSVGLGTTVNVTLGTTNGRPGETKELSAKNLSTLAGGLNVLGSGLGSGVALLLGGYQRYFLDWDGSKLVWVRLI